MLPWLFNVYMDGVVREINARKLGRDHSLVNSDDREWKISQIPFANDMVLVEDIEYREA